MNINDTQFLSDWLLENLKADDASVISKLESLDKDNLELVGLSDLTDSPEASTDDNQIIFELNEELPRVGRQYGAYSQYSLYSQSYSQYSFGHYSFYDYSFGAYTLSYGKYTQSYGKYTDYYAYGDYSLYNKYSLYTLYSFTYSLYTLYSLYNKYSLYTDYYFAYCASCQVCNTCQGKCQTKQKVSDYIGAFEYNKTMQSGTEITDEDWNKMVNWIKTGAPYNNTTSTISGVTEGTEILATQFNTVKNEIPSKFVDGSTGLADKSSGANALAADLVKLASTLNTSKINANISCCQTSGGQSCITCQDKCQSCQDARQ